jgi:D-alanyl-D-alanine carboxypeptidase/D-alanyl-D-alanine-endopeptidase (penicillin-binding protein 4)
MPVLAGMAIWCSAHAQLPEPVAKALAQAGIPDTHVGVVVQELDGTPLVLHGEERAFNPASVMKLVTTLAALDSLGPAHTFKTLVWLDGELKEGILNGNLVLQGGGDPGMTQERFWLLLRELRLRGIREIRGDVLLDNGYYAIEARDPGAFDQAPLRPYNAQPAALLVNFNTQNLRLCALEDRVLASLDPGIEGVRLENRLQPSTDGCNGWGDQLSARLDRTTLVLEGRLSSQCGERALALNLASPAANVAAWFGALWRELGGVHAGRVREGAPGPGAGLLMAFDSPPLSLLARDVNKHSNNVMAKMLFLNLGAARYGAPATWEKGERAIRAWLQEKGLDMPKLVLENGSGLSRQERISAASLARLLVWASRQPVYFEFAASLPAVGLEGTQKNRFKGNGPDAKDLSGRAWLKSGSLNGARNLAGYVLSPDGGRRVLVFFINHPNAGMAARAQEALLDWAGAYTKSAPAGGARAVNQQ